jgi:site-specific DNA recombinase
MTDTDRVALYSRVSTDDQTDRGTIKGQRDFLANFAQLYGFEVGGEYVDDGFSGTLPLRERPDGRRLLDDAQQGRFSVVLVYRLDRLGRSLSALLEANVALEQLGVTIRSATEPFDTSTPIGRFLFQLLGGLAELEKSTISERMTLGRDRVARNGKWTNGPIPFGYDLDVQGFLIPSARVVEGLNLNEAEIAQSVIQRIADGSSTVVEARRLNSLAVPTHRRYAGGAQVTVGDTWLPSRINQMVKNPVYAGTHILKSKTGPIERSVRPLVDRLIWDQAQAQLLRNRALSTRNAKRAYLLRGLIRCAGCGVGYVGTPSYGASGWSSHYYRCGSQLGAVHPEVHARCRGRHFRRSGWKIWCGTTVVTSSSTPGTRLLRPKRNSAIGSRKSPHSRESDACSNTK